MPEDGGEVLQLDPLAAQRRQDVFRSGDQRAFAIAQDGGEIGRDHRIGGSADLAVAAFEAGRIRFTSIARVVERNILIGAVNMGMQSARLIALGARWLVIILGSAIALEEAGAEDPAL